MRPLTYFSIYGKQIIVGKQRYVLKIFENRDDVESAFSSVVEQVTADH